MNSAATTRSSRTIAGDTQDLPRRLRPERRRLQLDRSADGERRRQMNGLSLHYYTLPTGDWQAAKARRPISARASVPRDAGQRVQDGRADRQARPRSWTSTIREKKIGLIVDEWGTWYDVEPGTNPGFLYQQNTLRDALVGGGQPAISSKRMPTACRWPTSRR